MDSDSIYNVPSVSLSTSRAELSVSACTSQSSLLNSQDSPIWDRAPRSQTKAQKECKKLEASIFKAQLVFCCLVVVCIFVLLLYIVVIALLLKVWPNIQKCHPSLQVQSRKVKDFMSIWKSHETAAIKSLMGNYIYNYDPGLRDEYCFEELQWLMKTFGKVNTSVLDSVNHIESQQRETNTTAQCCSKPDEESLKSCYRAGNSSKAEEEGKGLLIVFAHQFLNISYYTKYRSDTTSALRWGSLPNVASVRRGIDIQDFGSQFRIRHAGYYYVYSHVLFLSNVPTTTHTIVLKREKTAEPLVSFKGQAQDSTLQGVFDLLRDDSICVHAISEHLDTTAEHSAYFTIYLVRA